jgi:hypothetical protein
MIVADHTAWVEALDAYEASLEAYAGVLDAFDGDAELVPSTVPEFTPDPGLGPLPNRLLERAESLLVRSAELLNAVAAARCGVVDALDRSIARPRPPSSSTVEPGQHLDWRG